MAIDQHEIERLRAQFPAQARTLNGKPIAYFDGPGGTQVPDSVLEAIQTSYVERNANFDGAFSTSKENGDATSKVRDIVANFLGAESGETISFGANMTSLNYALSRGLARGFSPGDEVIITALDHEANRGPWLSLERLGIKVVEAAMLDNGELDYDDLTQKINSKTKLVAVGLASNAIGTVNDIDRVINLAKSHGALVVGDAVHYAAHFPLNVSELGIDFLLCSAYKFYGPHIGILYSRPGLLASIDTDRLSTQKQTAPYRIETGTLNYPALAGVAAAIDFINGMGAGGDLAGSAHNAMQRLHDYEMSLATQYYDGLSALPDVLIRGPSIETLRTPTISFNHQNANAKEIAEHLANEAIQVWHGHFYAQRVLDHYDLSDKGGLVRVGMSAYNTPGEVSRLLNALEDFIRRR